MTEESTMTYEELSTLINGISTLHDKVGDLPSEEVELDDAYSEIDSALVKLMYFRAKAFPLDQPIEVLDCDNQHDFEVCWRGTLRELIAQGAYPEDVVVRLKDPDTTCVQVCAGAIRIQKA